MHDLPCCDSLTSSDVAALEALIARGSTNCVDRARLAGHYLVMSLGRPSEVLQLRRMEQLLWLVDHCPTKGQRDLLQLFGAGATQAPELVARWEAQATRHSDNATVLGNLAALLEGTGNGRALGLLERAEELEPRNPRWPEQQADYLSHGLFAGIDDTHFPRAYAKLVRAAELSGAPDRLEQYEAKLAEAALRAGYLDKAAQHARRMLARADSAPGMWTGNLIYEGHAILGRIALLGGDVAAARKHLIEAGKTRGSPTLDTFGPDFTLANELLAAGERDVVIAFLDLVEEFWEGEGDRLESWRQQIRRGEIPRLRH